MLLSFHIVAIPPKRYKNQINFCLNASPEPTSKDPKQHSVGAEWTSTFPPDWKRTWKQNGFHSCVSFHDPNRTPLLTATGVIINSNIYTCSSLRSGPGVVKLASEKAIGSLPPFPRFLQQRGRMRTPSGRSGWWQLIWVFEDLSSTAARACWSLQPDKSFQPWRDFLGSRNLPICLPPLEGNEPKIGLPSILWLRQSVRKKNIRQRWTMTIGTTRMPNGRNHKSQQIGKSNPEAK